MTCPTGNHHFGLPPPEVWADSVTSLDALISATKGADAVFHLAALARLERSMDDPTGTHAVNVTGTLNVLRAAAVNKVPRVINSSSSSVYGDQPTRVMHEDMHPSPKSPYALQKLMGEQHCELFTRLYGLSVVSLRYFNVYGPRQDAEGPYPLVIPKFLRMRDLGLPLTVYGDGTQVRAYTHVSDVVEANVLAASHRMSILRKHLVLNIGTDEETSSERSRPDHRRTGGSTSSSTLGG